MNYVVLLEKFRDFYGYIDWKFCFLTFFQKFLPVGSQLRPY